MYKTFLVTRPNYDPATNFLFYWSNPVIELAKQKRFKVIDLSGEKANSNGFVGRVRKTDPSFIFLNGHGSDSTINGQDGQTLVSKENAALLGGRLIYARSCSSAKRLGPVSIRAGVISYIGYTEPFIFIHDPKLSTRPLSDKTAALFLEPSNRVATTLLKGHSISEANARSKEAFRKNIRRLITSESKKKDSSVLRFLFWDLKHQVCLGDSNACL